MGTVYLNLNRLHRAMFRMMQDDPGTWPIKMLIDPDSFELITALKTEVDNGTL